MAMPMLMAPKQPRKIHNSTMPDDGRLAKWLDSRPEREWKKFGDMNDLPQNNTASGLHQRDRGER